MWLTPQRLSKNQAKEFIQKHIVLKTQQGSYFVKVNKCKPKQEALPKPVAIVDPVHINVRLREPLYNRNRRKNTNTWKISQFQRPNLKPLMTYLNLFRYGPKPTKISLVGVDLPRHVNQNIWSFWHMMNSVIVLNRKQRQTYIIPIFFQVSIV